jgi:hypothetical protein
MQGKLDLGKVISRVFGLYGERFGSILGLALVMLVVGFLGAFAFVFIFTLLILGGGTITSVWMLVLVYLTAVVVFWATYHGTVIRIAQNAHQGRNERLGESISAAFSRAGALILAEVLIGVCIGGLPILTTMMIGPNPGAAIGFLLFLFPGLYFAARFGVAIPVLLVERKGATASMERSWSLTASNALRIFALVLLFGIVVAVASFALTLPFGDGSGLGGTLIYGLIELVVLWPPLALLTAVIYFDLRGPEPEPTVPTFGLPPVGAPGTIPAAGGAYQSSGELPPGVGQVGWDTSSSKPPPPPGS